MAQTSISNYFAPKKRGYDEDLVVNKKKVLCLEHFDNSEEIPKDASENSTRIVHPTSTNGPTTAKLKKQVSIDAIRQVITPQRTRSSRRNQVQNVDGIEVPKVVNFYVGGNLSPQKKPSQKSVAPTVSKNVLRKVTKVINETKTSETKESTLSVQNSEKSNIEKTLLFLNNGSNDAELKKKLKKAEVLTKVNKLRDGLEKLSQMREKRLVSSKPATVTSEKPAETESGDGKSLKAFKKIELEILSPKKTFSSPIKLKDSPMKNTLIGSPKHLTPKKLFSPTKSSPVKAPAYERFKTLAEPGLPSLQLPFKYRYLLEIFKAVDNVCAIFFNRKEKITFKKLKPAVQRLIRKNFYESHLAQINKLMPNAYEFAQEKTRNFGSTSKTDYYQLVIKPNVKGTNDDVNQLTLSPQLLIERTKEMQRKLTDLVYDEHDKFLQTLDVPFNVTRGALRRWHPDFQLENVPDVEQAELPQPPNVEKFSCAKDILSTARNLFNCSTPMERALERLDAKRKEEKPKQVQNKEQNNAKLEATPSRGLAPVIDEKAKEAPLESTASLLKGVPKSLLDKIRAKQAARALDQMTRRPSQERDAAKYAQLPEIARHVRNIFVTEKKGVLPLENLLPKLQNSYKARNTLKELEEALKLIAHELPRWLSFHDIRNMMFVKINRESDLTTIIEKLQELANKKAEIK